MIIKLPLRNQVHSFGRTDLVPRKDKTGEYYLYTCEDCGLQGKQRMSDKTNLLLIGNPSEAQIRQCVSQGVLFDPYVGKQVRILKCDVSGVTFSNLIENSIHTIVKPIPSYFNGEDGVWVMGVGTPVKIFGAEYTYDLGESTPKFVRKTKSKFTRKTKPKK